MCRSYKNVFTSQEGENNLILEFMLLQVWDSDFLSVGLEHTETKLADARETWSEMKRNSLSNN